VVLLLPPALLALDLTAPDELAVALLVLHHHLSPMSPSTAQILTSVSPVTVGIAPPPGGSQNASLGVHRAVVGTGLDVHEGPFADGKCRRTVSHATSEPLAGLSPLQAGDLHGGLVVLLLQIVPDVRKPGQTPPAGLEVTAA